MTTRGPIPSVSLRTAATGASTKANAFGMRTMQERAYEHHGKQYLLIKSPPASGKSRALMFIALDKLNSQGVRQAILVVPKRSIGGSFADEPLSTYGFHWDWTVKPQWNLCNAPRHRPAERGEVQGQGCRPVYRQRRQRARLHPCDVPVRGR